MTTKVLDWENPKPIIDRYLGGMSTYQLGKLFNHSKNTISKILSANEIILRTKNDLRDIKLRSIGIDSHYFEVPTIINSYWGGFIAADGCVDEHDRLRIALQSRDYDHLSKFKDTISPSHKLYFRGNGYNTYSLEIYSKRIVSDLTTNFNIVPRKSLILMPPSKLPFDLGVAYSIGYLDGDGSIGFGKGKNLFFQVVGTEQVLDYIKNFIEYFSYDLSLKIRKRNNVFVMSTTGNKIKKALNKMVQYVNVPYLERKWHYVLD